MPFDPLYELHLASLYERVQDQQLARLLRWAGHKRDAGIGVSITVLVGGFQIGGVLATPEQFAEHLDEGVSEAIEQSGMDADGTWREVLAGDEYGARAHLRAARDYQDEIDEEIERHFEGGGDRESMPDDLLRREIARHAGPAHFTLLNAVVVPPSGAVTVVPFIRVQTNSVAAWWMGTAGAVRDDA